MKKELLLTYFEYRTLGGEMKEGMEIYNENGDKIGDYVKYSKDSMVHGIRASNRSFALVGELMYVKQEVNISL